MYVYEDDVAEYDEFDEFDESSRRGRARFRPVPVPRRGNVVPAATPGRPVTHADLVNATRKLDEKIGVNARGIKSVEGRINAVAADSTRQTKALDAVRTDLKSLREISTLLPLLTTQKSAVVDGVDVLVPSNDTFSKFLPILLLSGGGGLMGGSSANGTDSGGLGGIGLPLMLMLATQK